jgi:hypothetical protein
LAGPRAKQQLLSGGFTGRDDGEARPRMSASPNRLLLSLLLPILFAAGALVVQCRFRPDREMARLSVYCRHT